MKNKKVIFPESFKSIKHGIACLYQLVFICGSYYIGSTRNLKTRISAHKTVLRGGAAFQRSSYRGLKNTEILYVRVLQYGSEIAQLRLKESAEIKARKNDGKLLNHRRTVPAGNWDFKPVEMMQ